MPSYGYKAFLSTSFSSEDRPILSIFRDLIESFEIQAIVYDYQEPNNLAERVRDLIRASDCLIAVVPRRQKLHDLDMWAAPEWIVQEVAYARAFGKPVTVFCEEGVHLSGPWAQERVQKFSREHLLESMPAIVKYLHALCRTLDSHNQFQKSQLPVLMRHYIRERTEIQSAEISIESCQILMESLSEELPSVHHAIEQVD